MAPTRQTISVHGHPLTVRRSHGASTPVLLLHGWTATSRINWGHAQNALGERFDLISYDQRGHGTGVPRGPNSIDFALYADDAIVVCDALGLGAVTVVGYSMGGAVAQELLRRHTARIRGMVLAATATYFVESGTTRGAARQAMVAGANLSRRLSTERRDQIKRWVLDGRAGEQLAGGVNQDLEGHDLTAVLEVGQALVEFDSRDWISQYRHVVPSAAIVTLNDTVVPPRRQMHTAVALPGTKLIPIPGGHSVCLEQPEVFHRALAEALVAVGVH